MADAAPPAEEHFSTRIRSLRGDLTVKAFAEKIGLSESGVRKLESAEANPTLSTLLRIQQAFGLASVEEIFGLFPSARLAAQTGEGSGEEGE